MLNLVVKAFCLSLLVVFFVAMPATASGLFQQVLVSFTEHLVFDQPAKSHVHCVVLCSRISACDRAVFSQGRCRGHRWAPECDGTVTLVWEREQVVTSVTYGKPVEQSSTHSSASLAVDGNPEHPSCSQTDYGSNPPFWWQVDLQATYSVTSVTIHMPAHWNKLRDVDIHVYTEDPQTNPGATGSLCYRLVGFAASRQSTLTCSATTAPGRYLRITRRYLFLRFCEVEVAACLVSP